MNRLYLEFKKFTSEYLYDGCTLNYLKEKWTFSLKCGSEPKSMIDNFY